MSDSPFTMPGSQNLGRGNQSVSPGKYTASPAKENDLVTIDAGKNKGKVVSKGTQNLINANAPKEIIEKSKSQDVADFKAKSAAPYASPAKDGTAHDHPHDRLKDADGNEIPASGLEGMDKKGRPQKK